MRKILFITWFTFIISAAYGQITISSEDFAKIGMNYPVATDTIPQSDSVSASGMLEKPWDFTGRIPDRIDTTRFIDPEQTPHAESFQEANMVTTAMEIGNAYLKKSEEEVRLMGFASEVLLADTLLKLQFEEPVLMMAFPAVEGDAYSSEASSAIADTPENLGIPTDSLPIEPDSLKIQLSFRMESEYDDTGILETEAGTAQTLRRKNTQVITVNVFAYVTTGFSEGWLDAPVFTKSDTTYSYNWYGKGTGIPLATLFHTGEFVRSIQYQPEMPPSVNANLKQIYVAGDTLQGFSPAQTQYQVTLEAQTEEVPAVTAVAEDSASEVNVMPAENLTGSEEERTTKIEVTSESGHERSYSVTFSREELSANSKLETISVNGNTLEGFDPDSLHYTFDAGGLGEVPLVSASPQDAKASITVDPAQNLTGDSAQRTTAVIVTAEDQSQTTYTITFYIPTGMQEHEAQAVKVYPSPASTRIYIEQHAAPARLIITDLSGRVVTEQVLNNRKTAVSVNSWTPGVYLYRIVKSGQEVTANGKFVVKP